MDRGTCVCSQHSHPRADTLQSSSDASHTQVYPNPHIAAFSSTPLGPLHFSDSSTAAVGNKLNYLTELSANKLI